MHEVFERPNVAEVDPIALIYTIRIDEARERTCVAYFRSKNCNLVPLFLKNYLFRKMWFKQGGVAYDNVLYSCFQNECNVYDGVMVKLRRVKIVPGVLEEKSELLHRVYYDRYGGAIFVFIPERYHTVGVFTSYVQDFSFIDSAIEMYLNEVERAKLLVKYLNK